MLPGDVVHVREGEYFERHTYLYGCDICWFTHAAVLQIPVSGTAAAPIRFEAVPGDSVVISGAGGASYGIVVAETSGVIPRHIELSGFQVKSLPNDCVLVENTSDVLLENIDVTECGSGAIGVLQSGRVTIDGCTVHHNELTGWTSPINFWLCKGGNRVLNSRIWANTDEDPRETEGHGIILDGCGASGGVVIENNVLWENEGLCINVFNSDNAVIRNNTCWRNNLGRTSGTVGELWLRGAHLSAFDNILVSRGYGPSLLIHDVGSDPETIEVGFNTLWSDETSVVAGWPPYHMGTLAEFRDSNTYGWGEGSLQLDPEFVGPSAGMFELSETSPAIDAGDNFRGAARDLNGFPRPLDGDADGVAQTDHGAFEFGGIFFDGFESGTVANWSVPAT